MKLTLKDIKILGEGAQIKKHIQSRYRSVEAFLKVHPIYELNTIRYYLKKKIIDNPSWQIKMVNAFNCGYLDLYLDPQSQVLRFLHTIEANIELYDKESDLLLIDEITKLCNEINKDLIYNCYYTKALIHINFSQNNNAIHFLNLSMQKPSLYNKSILDLGFCLFLEKKYTEAEKYYAELISTSDYSNNYLLLYRYGLLLNNTDRNMQAMQMYYKAVEATRDRRKKGKALMNVAVAYRRIAQYQKAINTNLLAIEYFEDDHDIGIVYDNIAYIHLHFNNYQEAYKYANMALNKINQNKIRDYFLATKTFVQIDIAVTGKSSKLFSLIDFINKLICTSIFRLYITQAMELVIKYGDIEQLNKLQYILEEMLDNKAYEYMLYEIKSHLYDVLKKKGAI